MGENPPSLHQPFKMESLDLWADVNHKIQLAVWDGKATPLTRKMRRFHWSCSDCIFDIESNSNRFSKDSRFWNHSRCPSCERQRVAHRTTKNMTNGVELLRRNGERIRMLTLTLPTTTVPYWKRREERLRLLLEAKKLFKNAKRTSEWKNHVTGYAWSFECPMKWHSSVAGVMKHPKTRPKAKGGAPVNLNAHVHIIITGKFWNVYDISKWAVKTGHQPVVDIRSLYSKDGVKYAVKKAVSYAAKEPSYGTVTRSTGGNIKQACQVTKWLYKNRKILITKNDQSQNYADSTE